MTPAQRIETLITLIPVGRVATYGQVADLAGLPGRARLVGRVLKSSERELPWHRIVGASGRISLPIGSAAHEEQVGRLQQEGVVVLGGRVRLKEWQWQPALAELLFLLPF
ncbi:MGMT family protein [Aeromonas sp. R9-1]|uniref:MGMT family protein n=1 Tax=Aeromonas sp. R9-1 TaxID=3138478 RepID=UPI0034A3C0E9